MEQIGGLVVSFREIVRVQTTKAAVRRTAQRAVGQIDKVVLSYLQAEAPSKPEWISPPDPNRRYEARIDPRPPVNQTALSVEASNNPIYSMRPQTIAGRQTDPAAFLIDPRRGRIFVGLDEPLQGEFNYIVRAENSNGFAEREIEIQVPPPEPDRAEPKTP